MLLNFGKGWGGAEITFYIIAVYSVHSSVIQNRVMWYCSVCSFFKFFKCPQSRELRMGRDISSVSASQNIKVMKYFSQYWQHDDCQNEDFFSSHCIRFYINKDLFFSNSNSQILSFTSHWVLIMAYFTFSTFKFIQKLPYISYSTTLKFIQIFKIIFNAILEMNLEKNYHCL